MDKKEFLQKLEEIVSDSIFIGGNESDLQKEIDNNMWCISANVKLAEAVTLEDLSIFIERVISNRKEQVQALKPAMPMLFYLWFDKQAVHLRLNVISDYGTGLPFGCKVTLVDNADDIIKDFLTSSYHDGFSIVDENTVDIGEEYDIQNYSLKVYSAGL